MKKNFYFFLICAWFCLLPGKGIAQVIDYWDGSVAASFSGGTGEQGDPYQIASGAELAYLAQLTNATPNYGQGMYFKLMNDLDLAGKNWTPIACNFITTAFRGNFDGGGHIIYNLKVVPAKTISAYGLFGRLEGDISCLGLENVDVTGDFYTGALCSRAISYSDGIKTVRPHITECYATGTVRDSAQYAGGLVGNMWDGFMENCYSTCSVYARFIAGGLVAGDLSDSYVTNCYAAGICSHDEVNNAPLGAFAGHVSGYIVNCYYDPQLNGSLPGVGDTLEGGSIDLIPMLPTKITSTPFPGWSEEIWHFKAGTFPTLRNVGGDPVGVSQIGADDRLSVYLNRQRNELHIRSSVPVDYLRVYDISGKLVLRADFPSIVPVDALRPGAYVVEAGNCEVRYRTKVLKY